MIQPDSGLSLAISIIMIAMFLVPATLMGMAAGTACYIWLRHWFIAAFAALLGWTFGGTIGFLVVLMVFFSDGPPF